ncbi:tetratricopeptide repeat protein [Pedococcus sp. 5OH_020]|uniref:tetratricopeptide repeat protein n=1 Tax=Pedococcus sp. 5OH_020 TaxID=2989814 RepID=UPI0022E9FE20|nr:tetratricopeptide repeat protein [Pedococcus sp. 5OH_020]
MTTMASPFPLRLSWARSLFDRGEYAGAATALAQLVAEVESQAQGTADGPLHGTTDLRVLLARAYFGSAQLGRAEVVLRELVEAAPDDGYLHLLLGRTLQRQGRHADARRHLALAEVLGDYARPAAYGEARTSDDR